MSAALLIDTLEHGLRLEPQHAHIARRLAAFDPELRLRRSASPERRAQGFGHILERKTRYTKPATSNDPDYRIAARDGYIIESPVHVSYLMREEAIVEALYDGDMARQTVGERFQALANAQLEEKQQRRKARLDDFRAFYRESYDVLDRLGDSKGKFEKTRINNAGVPAACAGYTVTDRRRVRLDPEPSSAGESPAQERSDEHQTRPATRRQKRELHRRSHARQRRHDVH